MRGKELGLLWDFKTMLLDYIPPSGLFGYYRYGSSLY